MERNNPNKEQRTNLTAQEKLGTEEPVTKDLPKLQIGIVVFALVVIALLLIAWSFDFFGLFS